MKKNIFTRLLLVVALLAVCCVFTPGKVRAEDQSAGRALNDLLGYIYNCEMIYSDVQWVLDSFESFDREKNWTTLQLARATLAIAKSDIARHKLPDLEMTADDQKNLMRRGIDVDFLSNLDPLFKAEQTSIMTTCMALNNNIMRDVFLNGDWEICVRQLANLRKIMDCDIQYLANTADWVLTSFNDPAITQKFNILLEKHCPETHARQRKNPETLENIESAANALLNQMESLVMEKTKLLGAANNRLNFVRDAIRENNLKLISKDLMAISDMPPVIFPPRWLNDRDIYYFWKKNDKVLNTPSPRTQLGRIPDGCRIRINGISLDNVKAYQKELEEHGLPCLVSWGEGQKFTVAYKIENSSFTILWENGNVTILMTENPICFVPHLYLSMMQEQRLQK